MRVVLLLLILLWAPSALAREVSIAHYTGATSPIDLAELRAAPAEHWSPVDAIRTQPQPSWWRLTLSRGGGKRSAWVLTIRQAFDAQFTAYLPPDYRARSVSAYDPIWTQVGSRHRLALELPADVADAPVYLELIGGRLQPMRVGAAPLDEYIAQDLSRVRISSMMHSALLLLALVAAVYAVALRRWVLLLFCAWMLCFFVYIAVGNGEVVWLWPEPALLQHAMQVRFVALGIGTITVFGFVIGFLDMPRHFPRLARTMQVLIAICALMAVLYAFGLFPAQTTSLFNLGNLLLALISLGAAVARARAGSPEGWFFLLGWGATAVIGSIGTVYFLRRMGTPEWFDIAHPAVNVLGGAVLLLATARAARYAEREMHAARSVARTDALTRLPNRSQLDAGLRDLMREARDTLQPLCLMFLDLDHFKAINDRYGHALGDHCLATVGHLLRRHVRAGDLVARYGGEEFVLALEGTGPERGAAAAEELRAAVQTGGQEIDGQSVNLTVSIGVTDLRGGDGVKEWLARADAALYRAKREGRNRVVTDFSR